MLAVACVQQGNYYGCGARYVRNLAAAVRQNITRPYRFVCLTDDPSGLGDDIEAKPLPVVARGWFAKLTLFRGGVFNPGERVLFLDLDTLITGNIDDIADYGGAFAGIGEFRKNGGGRFASGVMAWASGFGANIWDDWIAKGRPQPGGGDQEWIGELYPKALRLPQMFPGIVSYKYHKCKQAPSEGARIVCFHNQPKPHTCTSRWVREIWTDARPQSNAA